MGKKDFSTERKSEMKDIETAESELPGKNITKALSSGANEAASEAIAGMMAGATLSSGAVNESTGEEPIEEPTTIEDVKGAPTDDSQEDTTDDSQEDTTNEGEGNWTPVPPGTYRGIGNYEKNDETGEIRSWVLGRGEYTNQDEIDDMRNKLKEHRSIEPDSYEDFEAWKKWNEESRDIMINLDNLREEGLVEGSREKVYSNIPSKKNQFTK